METKPTKEGYYAWRRYDMSIAELNIGHIYRRNGVLWACLDIEAPMACNGALSTIDDIEWFKVEGL